MNQFEKSQVVRVLLDGTLVDSSLISPRRHRFLGLFRYPQPPDPKGAMWMCTCGMVLNHLGSIREHWSMGHMDVPEYQTVSGPKSIDVEGSLRLELESLRKEISNRDETICSLEEKYSELIFAVAKKFPGETRHQTALRYIQDAENHSSESAKMEQP